MEKARGLSTSAISVVEQQQSIYITNSMKGILNPELTNLTPCRIGTVNNDLMFEGEYKISRKNPTDRISFLGETHVRVNTAQNCYIKESEYIKLFGKDLS